MAGNGCEQMGTLGVPEGRPVPLCKAVGLRVMSALRVPILPEAIDSFGAPVVDPDSPEDTPRVVGFLADCVECLGSAAVGLNDAGEIVSIAPIPEQLSLADECLTEFGRTIMGRFPQADNI